MNDPLQLHVRCIDISLFKQLFQSSLIVPRLLKKCSMNFVPSEAKLGEFFETVQVFSTGLLLVVVKTSHVLGLGSIVAILHQPVNQQAIVDQILSVDTNCPHS